MNYNEEPLISIDGDHNPTSSTRDATQPRADGNGTRVKVLSWYDNERGFSNRMLDTAGAMWNA